ncbi:Phosphoglucose isomerase [Tribonema minus]|uniref:Glucose-6-phosphate isomerase n=1 Tax=Tribonema minus TaxID=303371 RepID=A0A836C9A9_9STRA|nr:Phosphoglucose isomerase [Tribonema minus]
MTAIYQSAAWAALKEHVSTVDALHLRDLMQDEARCAALTAQHGDILLDFSRQRVTSETMDMLFNLCEAADLEGKRAAMFGGEKINTTEGRAVFHVALRAPRDATMCVDGKNVIPDVHEVLDRIGDFATRVRSGEFKGCTGKPLRNVVSVGIGGSYLGPEFVYEALRTDKEAAVQAAGRRLRFLANVDPVDAKRALEGLDPEETLVVVVSKTFTTAETMLNARTLKDWLVSHLKGKATTEAITKSHIVAVSTSVEKCQAFGVDAANIFGFWDWVGGRYSVCSAVGALPLALQYGYDAVKAFLAGAHDMDRHFLEAPLRQNLPVLLGVLGVWNSTFLGSACRALLPYSQALLRFAAHIQQVDMESNGKRVAIDGTELPFEAGEVDFGEPGTNGQHSFYQLIHQGRIVPCDFLGYCESPAPVSLAGEPVTNHDELMSNFFAQADALAYGKTAEQCAEEGVPEPLRPHKVFPGNRPSSSLLFPKLNAFSLGQLLALYEHRTGVQGFIWGVNSFDQWGVELGKQLASKASSTLEVRTELSKARSSNAVPEGFNPSTTAMLAHFLKHSAAGKLAAAEELATAK